MISKKSGFDPQDVEFSISKVDDCGEVRVQAKYTVTYECRYFSREEYHTFSRERLEGRIKAMAVRALWATFYKAPMDKLMEWIPRIFQNHLDSEAAHTVDEFFADMLSTLTCPDLKEEPFDAKTR